MELRFVPDGCRLAREQRRESRRWGVSDTKRTNTVLGLHCVRDQICTCPFAFLSSFFFSEGPFLLNNLKSFVRFLTAGIKKMLKVHVSCMLSLWAHSQVMPLLESFHSRDEKKIYIFGFISKPVSLYIHLKKQEILHLEETEKKKS